MRDLAVTSDYWGKSIQQQKFRTGDMYGEIRDNGIPVDWRKSFFHNFARPRACFVLWLALRNRLPTKDRLEKIQVITDGLCSFCGQTESINHLFFTCRYTHGIWQKLLTWLGYNRTSGDWTQESRWFSLETNKKGWKRKLLKMTMAELIYHVWQERNGLIFNKQPMGDDPVKQIQYLVVNRAYHRKELKGHVKLDTLNIC
ncbi:uncharacterized protein LOC131650651 [Vicia villosa]|uniref:uncharacterized protein LOC131650651 n=1 Tax=Vicia villosa TaxID=3911 RepID=UPI00273B692B|nr:uncharacterized protein LOC131650651 [Vicia villosa]